MPSSTDPNQPPLLVVGADTPFVAAIKAQSAALWHDMSLDIHPDLGSATRVAGDAMIVAAVVQPAEAIARLLLAAESVGQALGLWTTEAQSLLATARRVRRRLRLVDARAFASGEASAFAGIGKAGAAPAAQDVPPRPEAALLMIAEAALACDPAALALADEIAALRCGGLDRGAGLESCEAALAAHRQSALHAQKAALLDAEVGLLRDALALQLAEDRQAVWVDGKRTGDTGADSIQDLKADLQLQTAKLDSAQRQLAAATEQAAMREATLAAILLQDQHDLLEQASARARAADLERELQRLYASRSWRVTGPLRALRSRG